MTPDPATAERKPDPATAERKPDTGPLTLTPIPPADERPARRAGWWRWAAALAVAALAVAALFILTRPPDPMQDQRPVEVVKGFAAAVEAKDATAMLSFVEPTVFRREIGPEVRAYLEYVEQISFADARYELLDNDGDRAHVRWTATMSYSLRDLGSGQRAVDTTFELNKIEGAWYLHSVRLPER